MFFYFDIKPTAFRGIRTTEEDLPLLPETNVLYLQQGKQRLMSFDVPGGKFLLLGDPVFLPKEKWVENIVPEAGRLNQDILYQEVKGHYYWFYLPETNLRKVLVGNAFGAIYPIYYYVAGDRVVVSSSSFTLAEKTNAKAENKRNLLERLLFNYPFFNSTWWSDIRLLDAHRYLLLDEKGARIAGNFEIIDYFGAPDDISKRSLSRLTELFEEETRLFFPEEPFAISLTGGFDGRTLVAAAKKAGREFNTYSFGRPDSTDVTMPKIQSARLGIPYQPIYLDEQYVEKQSLDSAWSLMQRTEYNGNFGRPHYHYAAQMLSEKTNYILTGNFGSELFRALHLPGVMMSECLIRIFSAKDEAWKDFLQKNAQRWDKHFFQNETNELIADIELYLGKMKGWDANHKFYFFVFNEIFRKYFGAELVMQSHYLNNRTPYLNLHFFKELNRTIWSGVHARLFEKMKSKRMKGQMFYATFIRQADKKLYHLKTNKGYAPADVLESWRLPLLAGRVIWHKYLNNKDIDDNSVDAFIRLHHKKIAERIKTEAPSFLRSALEKSLIEIPNGQNIEHWVKFYSIATGWDVTGATVSHQRG